MRSIVVKYSKLTKPVREAVDNFLNDNDPDLISFPYGGKLMKGFIFNHDDNRYLVINDVLIENVEMDDDDMDDGDVSEIETDFEGEGTAGEEEE